MRKRQLYILSLLSVFCAFGNNCVYGQESSDYGQERNGYEQNGFAYGQQNSAFGQKSSQFPMERLDRGLVALPAAGKGIFLVQDRVHGPGNGLAVVNVHAAFLVDIQPQKILDSKS